MLDFARHDPSGNTDGEPPVVDPVAAIGEICRFLSTTLGNAHRLDLVVESDVPGSSRGRGPRWKRR